MSARALARLLARFVALAAVAPATTAQDPIYDQLFVAHPPSAPGALEKTPDGKWLLVSEGGLLAFLDARNQTAFEAAVNLVKRVPNVFSVLADVVGERLLLYAGIWRHGVAVLEFLPDAALGSRLVHLKTIQTPGTASGLAFRDVDEVRQLIVADGAAGFRLFERAGGH